VTAPDDAPAAAARTHAFHALAFAENFALKELSPAFGEARRTLHELRSGVPGGGVMWVYPFGAVVFQDVERETREAEIARLVQTRGGLPTTRILSEDFSVREDPFRTPDIVDGTLVLDRLTPERASIVALTVAQSVAMEYYERIVEEMFSETGILVEGMEERAAVPARLAPLHRFVGRAIGTRNEVISVLHLLDKPDEVWDDPVMDHIYGELRAEFDLKDRYEALSLKLRSIQESLELVLGTVRDRRLFWLEAAIVALIVLEIVLSFVRPH
jgi:uncharacterized Rmd1/YagE family protein